LACEDLFVRAYCSVRRWQREDRALLGDQICRASLSAVANIAEGTGKTTAREFRRFLGIALGSLAELAALLASARAVEVLSQEEWGELEALRDHASRLTYGLFRAVGRRVERHRVV